MSVATLETSVVETVGDLLEQLGDIPAERVRIRPAPGEATERDCFEAKAKLGVLCELIDGTLVEKTMGLIESVLAGIIVGLLRNFVGPRRLGIVATPDGMFRVNPGQIRLPDVSFTSWSRLPLDYAGNAAADLAPDLVVEILSPSNTVQEMARKRREYFAGGTRLMWVIDPASKSVAVYVDGEASAVILGVDQVVDGGEVLPGFSFSIAGLFAEAERPQG